MIQFALETTGKQGSLAVLSGENVLFERRLGVRLRTAAELAVELNSALQWCEAESYPIDVIAVAVGPGSFTGLRIAVTTAKTLAYALGLPVVAVGSLSAIAAVTVTDDTVANVLVGLNAYRRQVFTAEFSVGELRHSDGINGCNHRATIVSRSEWDGRAAWAKKQTDWTVAADSTIFVPQQRGHLAAPGESIAVGVGRVAARLIAAAKWSPGDSASNPAFTDPFALATRYLRPSAAEEQAASR
ncbi:MAG: tRNA (adenosine(37)-N6)-threonylcarbamoyltransferase complex dimerization subunit type 1 TsaB [Planctomycetales bacterium]|nr:tRNA (adenosine(37)-N6)-threonylcarbamoyltransferase complex dimerization subunit type 1 TsaB [Planctomycetales bacterium]